MTYEQVLFETKEGVAWIRLNRPEKLNALTHQLATEAIDALEICAKEPEVRCVVITGEGRGFCAGQDLTEFQQQDLESFSVADHLRKSYNRLIQGLKAAGVDVDRKNLSEIAVSDPAAFTALVGVAKAALPEDVNARTAGEAA